MKKILAIFLVGIFTSCDKESAPGTLFQLLDSNESGFSFQNDLTFDQEFNVYTYRNYYNGGGVSIGDINGDDLPDIYMTANMKANKLFLNKGDMRFEDVTDRAGVAGTKAWSTGVTMADVNADGLLDIYVCNSGDIAGDNKQNELFINNGDMTFTESAEEFGLADQGFSTHASFFDYDKDGDLDVYILNNSYQSIGSFDLRRNERPKRDELGGDKLMRNDDGKFVDVSIEAGIYGSVIGFGLGVTVGDVNGDNYEDIYVSNDFFERDYLYINNQDGTFSERLTEQMRSISGASMGADMADINNDGHNDLFVTEMLPSDYERLKTVTTFEDWNKYQYNIDNGYFHQFTRNTFQLNNGDNSFSEIGRLAGVEATDWSWGALIFDFDNDGLKDLFVANGIYQDLTNQDYLQYVSNEEVIKSIVTNDGVDYAKLIDLIPSNPIPNHAFYNKGGLQFEDRAGEFGLDTPGFSNGSAYGDLDNDGDLDLVVNNVNMPSWLYQNTSSEGNYIKFKLKGERSNAFAVGAKIRITQGDQDYYVEQQPVRGFQSSMDPQPLLGLASDETVNVEVIWPLGRITRLENISPNQTLELIEKDGKLPSQIAETSSNRIFEMMEAPDWKHEENEFVDFHRDRLLWHMNSMEGPRAAVSDVDGDSQPEVYVGGSKESAGVLFSGSDFKILQEFTADAISEDAEILFFDLENDGDQDMYVASGGVEFSQLSSALYDRLYINDGKGKYKKNEDFIGTGFISTSTVAGADIDQDGDIDLFIGERAKPTRYGMPGSGFILKNENGELIDATSNLAPELKDIGLIKDGEFQDFDGDGDADLVLTGEFMGLHFFKNEGGVFSRVDQSLDSLFGWWNRLHILDVDGDGDADIVAGNHGLNSRFKTSSEYPITLFIADFDKNGSTDPILAKYKEDGEAYPFALRHNLIDQIKSLKKQFPDYESFRNASIQDTFTEEQLREAMKLEVNFLSSVVLINKGNFEFEVVELPIQTQLSPIMAISSGDYDRDGDLDVLVGGNLYGTKPEVGRYDASNGTLLLNDGQGNFEAAGSEYGFFVEGQIREILTLPDKVIVTRNDDSLVIFSY